MKDFDAQRDGNSLSEFRMSETTYSDLYSYLIGLIHDVVHDFLIQRLGDPPHRYYKDRNTWKEKKNKIYVPLICYYLFI